MQLDLMQWAAARARAEYRRAPPGLKLKRRREWILATARAM